MCFYASNWLVGFVIPWQNDQTGITMLLSSPVSIKSLFADRFKLCVN